MKRTAAPAALLLALVIAPAAVADTTGPSLFDAGTWAAIAHGSSAFRNGDADVHRIHAGATWFATPALSLDCVASFGRFERHATSEADGGVPATDGRVASFEAILRWYFHRAERWSAFVDGGIGVIRFDDEVPVGASDWNFDPQAGIGVTRRVGEQTHLLVGLRWFHVSHGTILSSAPNPGLDAAMAWVGVLHAF